MFCHKLLQNLLEFYKFMILHVTRINTSFPIALIFSSASRNHFSAVFQLRIEGGGRKKSKLVKSFHQQHKKTAFKKDFYDII